MTYNDFVELVYSFAKSNVKYCIKEYNISYDCTEETPSR